jgi:hypothetical protein
MPRDTYRVTLSDGRVVTLEADHEPTEADVLQAIGMQSAQPAARREPTIGADPNPQSPEIDAHGNRITRNPDGSVKFMQGPGFSGNADTSPDRNLATIGGFGIAPEDAMMASGLVRGAGRAVAAVARRVPLPSAAGALEAARVVGSLAVGNPRPALRAAARVVLNEMEQRAPAAVADAAPVAARVAPAIADAVPVTKAAPFNPSAAMQAAREAFTAAGQKPLPAEASNVMELIRRGKSPEDALGIVLKNRPAVVAKAIETVAPNIKLTADEVKIGLDMVARGKTPADALEAIKAQRAFLEKFGGAQTDTQARAAIDLRNARGQIKTPSAQTAELRRMP